MPGVQRLKSKDIEVQYGDALKSLKVLKEEIYLRYRYALSRSMAKD